MDELEVQRRARAFVRSANQDVFPVTLDRYLAQVGASQETDSSLGEDEAGWSTSVRGKLHITVNGNDSQERQRFTICHELAHHVLGIQSEHEGLPAWSYVRRPQNEVLCDVFAAELLLPVHLFKPLVDSAAPGFLFIEGVAAQAQASLMATASRFAALAGFPCAFVLSENRKIKYSVRSASLRAAKAWIPPRSGLPQGSVTERVCSGARCDQPEEVDPDLWFEDWTSGGSLHEDARLAPKRNQVLTLLWGEEDEIEQKKPMRHEARDEEDGYRELNGNLPWPGKKRRR